MEQFFLAEISNNPSIFRLILFFFATAKDSFRLSLSRRLLYLAKVNTKDGILIIFGFFFDIYLIDLAIYFQLLSFTMQ